MKDSLSVNGYDVIVLSDVRDQAIEDCARVQREGKAVLQPKQYHYSQGPRVFELWKSSEAVRAMAWDPAVLAALPKGAVPTQTISFSMGSNQPLHMDAIHFQTEPAGRMMGVWIALEDIDEEAGPLLYVPGTHRLPAWDFGDLGLERKPNGEQFENYHRYEEFIARVAGRMEKRAFTAKKGTAFVWGLNLIHGGAPILDPKKTRHSLVVHYYLPPIESAHAPMLIDRDDPTRPYRKSMRWFDREGNLRGGLNAL